MDQNADGQNQNFFRKNQNTLMILGGILILLIVFFATKKKPNDSQTASDQSQQQAQADSSNTNSSSSSETPTPPAKTASSTSAPQAGPGNVSVMGMLKASDNPTKGNLMLDSNQGKIYIQTKTDQSALMGQQVTLQAQGDIKSFAFLGFKEGQVAGAMTDTTAQGGGDTIPAAVMTAGNLNLSGTLAKSDNAAKGNYVVKTASSTVYLQTAKDYSAWVDQDVNLAATGTMQSFTGAVITKK